MWENIRWMWRGAQLMLLAIVCVRFFFSSDAQSEWTATMLTSVANVWSSVGALTFPDLFTGMFDADWFSHLWERLHTWFDEPTAEVNNSGPEQTEEFENGMADLYATEKAGTH